MTARSDKAKRDLGEQMLGLLLSLCLFALFIVWMVETPRFLRYGVSGVIVLLIIYKVISAIFYSKRLDQMRNDQAQDYRERGRHDQL